MVNFSKACREYIESGKCSSNCCGVIPLDKDLIKRNSKNVQSSALEYLDVGNGEIVPMTPDMKCLFLNRETNKCSIYEERPQVCKDYGTGIEPKLLCPYLKPNGNLRGEASQKQVIRGLKRMENMLERRSKVIHNI